MATRQVGRRVRLRGEVLLILTNERTGEKRRIRSHNIVTDAGDVFVAQKHAGETPTNAFGIMELGTAGDAPSKGSNRSNMTTKVANSQKAFDSGYPKTNDDDPDNTGAGVDVTTRRVSYTTAEANAAAIDRLILTNVTPGASEPVLDYATMTAVTKTSSDTLKVIVNITQNGV